MKENREGNTIISASRTPLGNLRSKTMHNQVLSSAYYFSLLSTNKILRKLWIKFPG